MPKVAIPLPAPIAVSVILFASMFISNTRSDIPPKLVLIIVQNSSTAATAGSVTTSKV